MEKYVGWCFSIAAEMFLLDQGRNSTLVMFHIDTHIKTIFIPTPMLCYCSIKHSFYVGETGVLISSLLLCTSALGDQTCCPANTFLESSSASRHGLELRNFVCSCVPSTYICAWSLVDGRMNTWMHEWIHLVSSCWYWFSWRMIKVLHFYL